MLILNKKNQRSEAAAEVNDDNLSLLINESIRGTDTVFVQMA